MPRSAFSQNLPNLIRRYGAEEEEEINYNYLRPHVDLPENIAVSTVLA